MSTRTTHMLNTGKEGFYGITAAVRDAITKIGVDAGLCVVYCPHTTAGITINENADPDVVKDLLHGLDKAFPDKAEFRHSEGNRAAHLKASYIGSSVTLIVENGRSCLAHGRASTSASSTARVSAGITSRSSSDNANSSIFTETAIAALRTAFPPQVIPATSAAA